MSQSRHYSRATARARDLFCSRVRATAFRRAKMSPSTELVSALDVFRSWVRSPRAVKNIKKVIVALGSYCSMMRFYRYCMFFYCPLDKPFKGFNFVGRSPRERGVVPVAPTAPLVPCYMVRNDIIFTTIKMSLLWNGC